MVLDITDIIKKERESAKKEKQIYSEVIEAVTGGKLLIKEREAISPYMAIGESLLKENVSQPADLEKVRAKVGEVLASLKVIPKDIFMFSVCISEALTNTLKHAQGGTCVLNFIPEKTFRVEISDNGPGISFNTMPKATLMKSFSTQQSLGCGFSIMLKYVDRIIMSTDSDGTTIIMEKSDVFIKINERCSGHET